MRPVISHRKQNKNSIAINSHHRTFHQKRPHFAPCTNYSVGGKWGGGNELRKLFCQNSFSLVVFSYEHERMCCLKCNIGKSTPQGCGRLWRVVTGLGPVIPKSRTAQNPALQKPICPENLEINMLLDRPVRTLPDAARNISVRKLFCAEKEQNRLQNKFSKKQDLDSCPWASPVPPRVPILRAVGGDRFQKPLWREENKPLSFCHFERRNQPTPKLFWSGCSGNNSIHLENLATILGRVNVKDGIICHNCWIVDWSMARKNLNLNPILILCVFWELAEC